MMHEPVPARAPARPPGAPARLPELLAPAGDWDCVKAAVENGADAVYFGLEVFNARMRARNFTTADLPRLLEYLHRRGVRGYVTFNTLVFPAELAEAERQLRAVILAGVDAAIVQDAGICRLIRSLSPDFPIHASTQMTITSAAGLEFARELGCQLAVLARECSLAELDKIRAASPAAPLPMEVFVHGALCVAYSGQCLTSESLGGRSANRGECAQACRMPYDLICDGAQVPLGDKKYLLSPQDLAGLEVLPELVRAGVVSLKIEGRLKAPEYVAAITRLYRQALDRLAPAPPEAPAQARSEARSEAPPAAPAPPPDPSPAEARYEMEMSFSRGLSTGWFRGVDNQKLVHARFGKKRGAYLGDVQRVERGRVWVRLAAALKPGDGVVFDAGQPAAKEEGGRVYQVVRSPQAASEEPAELRFGQGDLDFSRLHAGDKVWKTSDPELDRRWRQSFAGETPRFQRGLELAVHGAAGLPLTVIAWDEPGRVVQAVSTVPLAPADKTPLSEARLREQLGRLGGTPFKLDRLANHLQGPVVLPVSELNRLRRELVRELEARRAAPRRWQWHEPGQGPDPAAGLAADPPAPPASPAAARLVVLVRDLPQLEAALRAGAATVYCEFEDPKKYREAVTRYRAARATAPPDAAAGIFLAPPRVFKMGEDWILEQVQSARPDGFLARNHDHLRFFAGQRCIGDFSLNVANRLSAAYFKTRFNLERLTASYDLNAAQLEDLLRSAPPAWFEITVHQHMPMFHMEHCVFCAFLSQGHDYRDCGRPCDRHVVRLRDRVGAEHPLKADAGCRNTMYNAQAQTGAEWVAAFLALGVRHFRVEFLTETPAEVERTLASYHRLLRGEITGARLWRDLKLFNQLGVTRGQLAK